jgi:hypothetical protein
VVVESPCDWDVAGCAGRKETAIEVEAEGRGGEGREGGRVRGGEVERGVGGREGRHPGQF